MADKYYIDAQQLLEDAFKLGAAVINSGFQPSYIVAIWRGAAPIGIAVQEFLAYHGINSNHIALRTASYAAGIDQQARQVKIYSLNYLVKTIRHDDRLLIVDDVYDTGNSIDAVITSLRQRARLNTPEDIRIAVPYYKPARNQHQRVPDYYLHETDQWLKFPHSLEGLDDAEIAAHRSNLHAILASAEKQ